MSADDRELADSLKQTPSPKPKTMSQQDIIDDLESEVTYLRSIVKQQSFKPPQMISFQLFDTPSGIDGKIILRLATILGLEPVGDNMNVSLLRVSFPVFHGNGQQLPGYLIKGSVTANTKRLSEAFSEPIVEPPNTIDIAPPGLVLHE